MGSRSTKDIDLLGRGSKNQDDLVAAIRDIIDSEVADDGVTFDPESVQAQPIRIDAKYDGVRLSFRGNLANAELSMQVDVGFGDVITPGPETVAYPSLLDLPRPSCWRTRRKRRSRRSWRPWWCSIWRIVG